MSRGVASQNNNCYVVLTLLKIFQCEKTKPRPRDTNILCIAELKVGMNPSDWWYIISCYLKSVWHHVAVSRLVVQISTIYSQNSRKARYITFLRLKVGARYEWYVYCEVSKMPFNVPRRTQRTRTAGSMFLVRRPRVSWLPQSKC